MTEAPTNPALTKQQALNKAANEAMAQLREENLARFNDLKQAAVKALGFEWTPRPTAADKARQELAALLSSNPDLRAELVSQIEAQVKGNEGEQVVGE